MNEFDLIHSPLTGVNLIEASAGTGKTHTISFLLLRLILEKKLTIDRILMVTFTQAATQELKEKVLSLLLKTRDAIISGKSDDQLIETLMMQREKNHQDIETIQNAISDFDKSSIFTIHGFCSRILHDNAFEISNRFGEELVQDPFLYLQEVTDDFWRKNIYQSPVELVSYIYTKLKGPDYFLKLLNKVNALEIDIIPSIKHEEIQSLIPYHNTLIALKDIWSSFRDDILVLLADESLKGNIYGSLKSGPKKPDDSARNLKIQTIADDMDLFLTKGSMGFPLFKNFQLFTTSKIKQSVKKGGTTPGHTFFDVCDELHEKALSLEQEFETYLLYLKGYLFTFAETELDKIKNIQNIRFFNDLILKVRNAIRHSADSDHAFIMEIRNKYIAALVDEFQDTDSVQYEIFSTLFSSKENLLFMIGDPKQAIYSFRGADVFSYMEAARKTDASYTLNENWRSSRNLITAVNTFFSNIKNPFIFNDISFEHGRAATNDIPDHQADIAPVKIWFVRSDSGKLLNKADAEKITAKAVANEIILLISSNKNNCNEQFKEGDIAVLVQTNRQAMVMKDYLSRRQINAILFRTGDIYESHEAGEMERLLTALNDPANDSKMKSALCTDMMGIPAHMFDPQQEEVKSIEDIYKRFKSYKRLWEEKDFTPMFNHFLAHEEIKERLLAYPDGERRVTNILQLGEILQNESVMNKRRGESLLKWFAEQRDPDIPRKEENQLHLESDRCAVNIVTMHKSKGLEYPVVFCPFSWEGMRKQDDDILFHSDEDERKLMFDLRGKESGCHLNLAQKEQFAENMRLFYVAVTRAKQACYLAWGNIKSTDTSPISYLLYGNEIVDDVHVLNSLINYISTKSSDDLFSDIRKFSSQSDGTIEVLELKDTKGTIKFSKDESLERNLFSRNFHGHIDTSWRIQSYSSLISAKEKESDVPDHDTFIYIHPHASLIESEDNDKKEDTIFTFPKGAKAGIFFHDLLEHLDFTCSQSDTYDSLVSEKLLFYGFDSKWNYTVYRVIDNILNIPLAINNTPCTLSQIENDNRINEMEFYYPLNKITPEKIFHLFSKFNGIHALKKFPSQQEKLIFAPTQGFMKGYIDLVFLTDNKFFIIDWKSNLLGTDNRMYAHDYLVNEMNHSFYTLQYHIYALALHQYLRHRFPGYSYENNFGGIFYMFIRGVDKQLGPSHGIYKDLPNPELLNSMGKMLIPGFKGI